MVGMKTFRSYEIIRDENGMPTKMIWRGDYRLRDRATRRAEMDQRKLAEHEKIYGKRT